MSRATFSGAPRPRFPLEPFTVHNLRRAGCARVEIVGQISKAKGPNDGQTAPQSAARSLPKRLALIAVS